MYRSTLAIITLLAACLAGPAAAQDYHRVKPKEIKQIDAHGVCRRVGNLGGKAIMIPVKSASEWSSGAGAFLNHEFSKIDIYTCVEPTPWSDYDDYVYTTCSRRSVYEGLGANGERTVFTYTEYKSVNGVQSSRSWEHKVNGVRYCPR